MTAPRTPPEGWVKTVITEYKPAGCPPPGSIWWTDPDSGASTPITTDEDEAIARAWALKARMERTTMQPYYQKDGITIYHGDCRELLPWLATRERARLVLADPPYGVKERTERKANGRSNAAKSIDWVPVAGDDEPYDPAFILALQLPTVLWGANHYADKVPPSPSWFVWDKRDGTTPDDNADCELAWTNLGGPMRMFSHLWRGMIKASERSSTRLHPTQKPVALMRWCLTRARVQPGDLILDPYMGSGPVALACKAMGLRYIGIELVEQYCAVTVERLADAFKPALVDNTPTHLLGPLFDPAA